MFASYAFFVEKILKYRMISSLKMHLIKMRINRHQRKSGGQILFLNKRKTVAFIKTDGGLQPFNCTQIKRINIVIF